MDSHERQENALAAEILFENGFSVPKIAARLNTSENTIAELRKNRKWGVKTGETEIEIALANKVLSLLDKSELTLDDLALLRPLVELYGQTVKDQAMRAGIRQGLYDGNEDKKPLGRAKGCQADEPREKKKRKSVKNDISSVAKERLDEVREQLFFDYQKLWHQIKNNPAQNRTRFILKSRQIGATYYFAWEALEDAILTGDNQIFLSASRDQAEVFRAYIIQFAKDYLEIELAGNPIILSNGAELRFLSTCARTAQSYHGHLYVDEVFWIPFYHKVWKVASAMAAHKRWRRTLFSTPSAISHDAYAQWSGELFNEGRSDKRKVEFDLSPKALARGQMGEDRIWRHLVTIEDAERQGCNLFDVEELKHEYNPDDFRNLFLCEFVDDARSVFSLNSLLACCVDPDTWKDYRPHADRPYQNHPVAVGYDPQHSDRGDNASLVVMSVPLRTQDKWRVLKRQTFRGLSFEMQAKKIWEVTQQFNVVHIGIDIQGIGYGVYEHVQAFFPSVEPINYSVQIKNLLVTKAMDVIQEPSRLEFDAGDKDLIQAFLAIRKTTTASGGQVTYFAQRSQGSHADPAWAVMHAMKYEPIHIGTGSRVAFT